MVEPRGIDLHFHYVKIMDRLRQAVGGNSPPDCCIYMGSIPKLTIIKDRPKGGLLLWWR